MKQSRKAVNRKKDLDKQKSRFFAEICIKGPNDIKSILNIDCDTYKFIHYRAISKSRNYFLYNVMNDIEKAGLSVMRLEDFFDENTEIDENDQLIININQSIEDEQSLWIRKLTEILTELVLFSTINEDDYYKHYMLVKDLKSLKSTLKNSKNAYGCCIGNYEKQIDDLVVEINKLENSSVDIQKCWYLARGKKDARVSGIKGRLASFEERINDAFDIAKHNQIIALGISFEEGYGNLSGNLHFNVNHNNFSRKRIIDTNIAGIGLLAANIIVQSRKLLKDRRRKGYSAFLNKLLNKTLSKEALKNRTKPDIKKGDFVNAQGDLAEVVEVMRGRYGFRSFKLKFLLSEDTEIAGSGKNTTVWTHKNPEFEEFPAMWVQKLYSRQRLLDDLKAEILKNNPNSDISTVKLTPLIRDSVIHIWKNVGLKESIQGKKDIAIEKIKQEQKRININNLTKKETDE